MSRIARKALLVQLALIEAVHEKLQGSLQCFRTARKTARATCEPSQVMAQLGVVGFNRIGVCLALGDFIDAPVIPQALIDIKSIAVIAFGLRGFVYHLLDRFLGSLPDHFAAKIATSEAVYNRDNEDLVFLSPMKVNNSSISTSLTWSGTGGSGSWAAWALTHRDTVRW